MPQKLLLSLALICVSVNACKDDFADCLDWAAQTPSLCNVTTESDFMSKHCKLSCKVCFETSAYGDTCADNHPSCGGWAGRGECQNNRPYMSVNCKKSCNLCDVSCNRDGNPNCPSWASTGECDKNPNWMKQNCKLSCNTCVAFAPSQTSSSCQDTGDIDCKKQWGFNKGKCDRPNQKRFFQKNCKKSCNFCSTVTTTVTTNNKPTRRPTKWPVTTKRPTRRITKWPTRSSPTTRPTTRSTFNPCTVMNTDARPNALTVVFVASNYNDGDTEFANQANKVVNLANTLPEFDKKLIKFMYVRANRKKSEEMNCYHGDGDQLKCDNFNVVRQVAARCVQNPTAMHVIHKADHKWGGIAYGNIAITTSYPQGPNVAIHEFGHSLFMLSDEYDYGKRRTGAWEKRANCDFSGNCENWKDLIGQKGVECVTACDGGKSSGPSLMNDCYTDVYFGLVNSRLICCIYKKKIGVYPDYCDKFKNGLGTPLQNYCASHGLGGSRAAGFMKLPPGENVGMSNPCRIKFVRNNDGSWASSESTKLPEDLYPMSEINGDVDDCQLGECHPTTGEARLNFQVEHQGVITYTSFKPTRSIEFIDYDNETNSAIGGTSVQTVTELTIIADCAANVTYKGECKAIQNCSLLITDPGGFVQASCPLKVDKTGCQYCQCAQAQPLPKPPADMIDTDTQAEETSNAAKLMAPLVLGAIAFTL